MSERLTVQVFSFLKINLLLFPVIVASLIWDYFGLFAVSYLSALLHEFAHIFTARKLGIGISYIKLQPFGVCAVLKSSIINKPIHEITVALAGPMCSLLLAGIYYLWQECCGYFVYCNLALALLNILPILPLDGGRVLRATLTTKMGAVRAYNTAVKLSHIPTAFILVLSVYALLTAQFNFSLILIGVFLLGNLLEEKHNISRQAVLEILNYKDKLRSGELNNTSVICADKSTPARKILHCLSYNKYHIIHMTDDKLRVVKTFTEGQLLEAITQKGIRITLEEV